MAITRTAMIDDDGSGTTGTILNNAWKQELYQQIDTIPAVVWTPVDASGAGLSFAGLVSTAWYVQVGKIVTVNLNMTFPTTANGLGAAIGGLPFPSKGGQGFTTGYSLARVWHLGNGATSVLVFNATTGAQYTNAQLSGAAINFSGAYICA